MKSRLVAGGHRQKPETYGRTSSPTVDISHVMLALSLRKKMNAKIATIDVAAAFLHADLKETIHMVLPRDVVRFLNESHKDFIRNMSKGKDTVVVLLKKSLYGLKQSSHNWNNMVTTYLREIGFRVAQGIDGCVFARGSVETGDMVIALLHVDDLMLIAQKSKDLSEIKIKMTDKFGEITYHDKDINFLGMNVLVNDRGAIFLNQPGYARRICDQEGTTALATTPATATLFSDIDDTKTDHGLDSTEYKSLLMSLMFWQHVPDQTFSRNAHSWQASH